MKIVYRKIVESAAKIKCLKVEDQISLLKKSLS